jgi:two-component system cell cycle response regulator
MDELGRQRILVVDDDRSTREALAALLGEEGYDVTLADDGTAALVRAQAAAPDLVLTDLEMPDLGGLGLLRRLRADPRLAEVPVIIMSAHHDTQHRIEGFALGADDFVPKPVDFPELSWRIRRHLYRARRQEDALRQSVSDELTGILNRRGVDHFFARSMEDRQSRGGSLSILLVDVDRFKSINDRFGHAVGDGALRAVARMLQDNVRATDGLGRIGGDEFLIVLPGADARVTDELVERLREQLPLHVALPNAAAVPVTFSAGSASAAPRETLEQLIARADRAMYDDKRRLSAEQPEDAQTLH